MQTKSIVQASANVIRIVNLQKGDIYKRYESSSYGSDKIHYGIVNHINNNGEETFIESTEYEIDVSEMNARTKVFSGTADISIFPATLEDLENDFKTCLRRTKEKLVDKEKEVKSLIKAIETTERLVSGELQKELQTPAFKELTQAEFNQKKLQAESNQI